MRCTAQTFRNRSKPGDNPAFTYLNGYEIIYEWRPVCSGISGAGFEKTSDQDGCIVESVSTHLDEQVWSVTFQTARPVIQISVFCSEYSVLSTNILIMQHTLEDDAVVTRPSHKLDGLRNHSVQPARTSVPSFSRQTDSLTSPYTSPTRHPCSLDWPVWRCPPACSPCCT